jgi:hypothetical protein
MNGTIEAETDAGLTTGAGLSFGAKCSLCEAKLTTRYYCVNGHDICPDCRGPVLQKLARQHGTAFSAFLRGWLLGSLSGVSGYVVYAGAMALLRGYDAVVAMFVGPIVWKVTRWANPGCSTAYRVIAISITYSSILLASIPEILQNLIDANMIDPKKLGDFWINSLNWAIEWVIPALQHPASFLVIMLIGFGIGEVIRLRQQRSSLIQGPFTIGRRRP